MTEWLTRQEAVQRFTQFLDWALEGAGRDEVDEVKDDVDVADGDEEAAAHAEINTELTKDTNGDQIASHVSLQHGESTYTIPK